MALQGVPGKGRGDICTPYLIVPKRCTLQLAKNRESLSGAYHQTAVIFKELSSPFGILVQYFSSRWK